MERPKGGGVRLSEGSGLSAIWLGGVNKDRVSVGWPGCTRQIKGVANCATVVGAVVYQVVNHLLAGQHSTRSVHELESDALISLIWTQRVGVILEPLIRSHQSTIKLL